MHSGGLDATDALTSSTKAVASTLTILLATLRRWCTVPHRFAARHSLGAPRGALNVPLGTNR